MMPLFVRSLQSSLAAVLLWTGTGAYAQDDMASGGIETFRETCLMADARPEKIFQWATDRDLKLVQGPGQARGGTKTIAWEVASSGGVAVILKLTVTGSPTLSCSVMLLGQDDADRQIETFFLADMKGRSNVQRLGAGFSRSSHTFIGGNAMYGYGVGRLGGQDRPSVSLSVLGSSPPPDVALRLAFANPERTFRIFVKSCLESFPNIKEIGEAMQASGWQPITAVQTSPSYRSTWVVNDPFEEMSSYLIDLKHSQRLKSCNLAFDRRAAMPMERLVSSYALVQVDDPDRTTNRSNQTIEYYSGVVGGTPALFRVRTDATTGGEVGVSVETPR